MYNIAYDIIIIWTLFIYVAGGGGFEVVFHYGNRYFSLKRY